MPCRKQLSQHASGIASAESILWRFCCFYVLLLIWSIQWKQLILHSLFDDYLGYHLPLTVSMINIGKRIQEELEQQERSISWLARKLDCNRTSVYRILKKNSIDTALLGRISQILNCDFFQELSKDMSQPVNEWLSLNVVLACVWNNKMFYYFTL